MSALYYCPSKCMYMAYPARPVWCVRREKRWACAAVRASSQSAHPNLHSPRGNRKELVAEKSAWTALEKLPSAPAQFLRETEETENVGTYLRKEWGQLIEATRSARITIEEAEKRMHYFGTSDRIFVLISNRIEVSRSPPDLPWNYCSLVQSVMANFCRHLDCAAAKFG